MRLDDRQIFLRKLGKRIRQLRIERGLRQEDFDDGTEMGITSRGFQEIEYGHKDVRIYTLCKIAQRLKVTLSDLLDLGQ